MTLLEFYRRHRPKSYGENWHHRQVCRVLQQAYEQRQNAILELPPRHSKSEIANIYAPCWWLATHPDAAFGLIANSDNLASKFSSAARNLLLSPAYQRENPFQLSTDREKQWKVKTDSGLLDFSYLAAGISAQITGHGFSCVTFDDLLKSGAEAKSDAKREGVWDNIISAALNRLTPDGIVVCLQARLHLEDPIGKLLELPEMKFLRLHLPAVNSGDEAWFEDQYAGTTEMFPAYSALWPDRYDRKRLDEIATTVSSYYWNAQYQQTPSLGDLSYFDLDKCPRWSHPDVERLWIGVDAAQTETQHGSYSAFVCVGSAPSGLKVLGVRRGRWRQDVMIEELLDFCGSMARLTGIWPECVIVEAAAAGFGIIDHLSAQLPIQPIYPKGSKENRAGSVCYVVNRGHLALPEKASWLAAFESEVRNFPLAANNDQVDALVHCLSYPLRPSEFKPGAAEELLVMDAEEFLDDGGVHIDPDLDAWEARRGFW